MNEAIRISERPGVDRKVYEVLREWGYSENVIQRLLAEDWALDHNSQKAEKDLLHPIISTRDVSSNPSFDSYRNHPAGVT